MIGRILKTGFCLALVLSLASCFDSPTDASGDTDGTGSDPDNRSPNAVILSDTTSHVGDSVSLDGRASSDADGDSITFHWSIVQHPQPGTAALSDTMADIVRLTPERLGTYIVQLVVSDGQVTDTARRNVHVGIETLDHITSDRTLIDLVDDPREPDYLVEHSITVSALLRIEPGVRIEVSEDATITVSSKGVLMAAGAEGDSVVITSDNIDGGVHWGGLLIESSDKRNSLSYTRITHGGGDKMFWLYEGYNGNVKANVALDEEARLSVSNSTVSHSGEFGILLNEHASLDTFRVNRLYGNAKADLFIPVSQVAKLDRATVFDDTTAHPTFFGEPVDPSDTGFVDATTDLSRHLRRVVRVYASSVASGEEHVWKPLGSRGTYHFSGNVTIGGDVTIEAETVIESDEDVYITVSTSGVLRAKGGESSPVTLTSASREGGVHWAGLLIQSSDRRNSLRYTNVEYGGGDDAYWLYSGYNANVAATVALEEDARLSLTNSRIANSGAIGLVLDEESQLESFGYNVFSANTREGIVTNVTALGLMDSISRFEDNGTDRIRVYRSSLANGVDQTWVALGNGNAYLFSGGATIKAALTLAPGVILHFREDVPFSVSSTGSLTAIGTATTPIVMTSANAAGGTLWRGLSIASKDVANKLDYVTVSFGGGGDSPFWLYGSYNQDGETTIGVDSDASLTLTNSTVSNSGKFGLAVKEGATVNGYSDADAVGETQIGAVNTFENNADDDIAFE
jgi:hypothetical protein